MIPANIKKNEKGAFKLKRRKLWEGSEGYHCSIIGTCLRRNDIRKLAQKKVFGLNRGLDDFQIHTHLVSLSSYLCPQAKMLHKILDAKYRGSIRRYNEATQDDAIERLWCQDNNSGAIAGAYWAVMTHPTISRELRSKIYGQVHMLSHDFFVLNRVEKQGLVDLRNKTAILEEVLSSERQLHREAERKYSQSREMLAKLYLERKELQIEKSKLETQVEGLRSGVELRKYIKTTEELKEELVAARQVNSGLLGSVDSLEQELTKIKEELIITRGRNEKLEERCFLLQREKEEIYGEIESVETTINQELLQTSANCDHCDDQNTERCPGPDLCGRTILYVGGLRNMVPRYRQLVEKMGGRFIHHDGGKEISPNQLPKMLQSADAVFCPIDCISHDATSRVKQICKRNQKPFVMMRSSGLSSLAKGLTKIVQ